MGLHINKTERAGHVLAIAIVLLFAAISPAATVRVPTDYATIQAGINATVDGDTVLVAAGAYIENISFDGKNIVVRAEHSPSETRVLPADPTLPIVSFTGGEGRTAVIEGFLLMNTTGAPALKSDLADPTIRMCEFTNCYSSGNRGVIFTTGGSPKIEGNSFYSNTAVSAVLRVSGSSADTVIVAANRVFANAGIAIIITPESAPILVERNVVHDNIQGILIGGAREGSKVVRNIVYRNVGGLGIGLYYVTGTEISNNTVWDNETGILLDWNPISAFGQDNIIGGSSNIGLYDARHFLSNNLLWHNATNFANPPHLPQNYIVADPKFTDPGNGDFSLRCESPAIDRGASLIPDPDGSAPDMGAVAYDHRDNQPSPYDFHIMNENHSSVGPPPFRFAWTPSFIGVQTAYQLEIGTDDDWEVAEIWSSGEVSSASTEADYQEPFLTPGAVSFARLRIQDVTGWGCWHSFVFRRNAVPSPPAGLLPANNGRLPYQSAKLSVASTTDPENDPVICEFEVYSDSLLADLHSSETVNVPTNNRYTTGVLAGLSPGNRYWWRARWFDGIDYSEWSAPIRFLADASGPINVPREFATIQGAVDWAISGDTILVAPGIYREWVRLRRKAITLIATGDRDSTILRRRGDISRLFEDFPASPEGTTIAGFHFDSLATEVIVINGVARFLNCRFTTVVQIAVHKPGILLSGGSVSVSECLFDGYGNVAVAAASMSVTELAVDVEVTNCRFHLEAQSPGDWKRVLWVLRGSPLRPVTVNICNNTFDGAAFPAISVEAGVAGVIQNNTIANVRAGISSESGPQLLIRNNSVSGCSEYGISAPTSSVDYNNLWNNGVDYLNTTPGPNDISADPIFVDPVNGDLRLRCDSPCIDAGDPQTPVAYSGHAIDIGAHEYAYVIGDADGSAPSSVISLTDAVFLINSVFGGVPLPCPAAAGDVDCSGTVSISDAVYLLHYLYSNGPAPCGGL